MVDLFKILLTTFTISVTALKIPFFDTALKAGVTANIFIMTIAHQIPPQFGCICAYGMVKCSPVYKSGLYQVENECFWDWWFRFAMVWGGIVLCVILALRHEQYITRINLALVAGEMMRIQCSYCTDCTHYTLYTSQPLLPGDLRYRARHPPFVR
jgi:hypothetical protein